MDIWLTTPSGDISVHLTSMNGPEDTPSWTSDGETLMFHAGVAKDEFWLATDLPVAPVGVTSQTWSQIKKRYR